MIIFPPILQQLFFQLFYDIILPAMYAYPLYKSHKLEPDQLMQANIQHTKHVNQIASIVGQVKSTQCI